ncbi:MAG: hypothetical protein IPN76_03895 [Saprospiraceae bacterium]|nr:hypothetical protein [Saprospiraceae bacterium]
MEPASGVLDVEVTDELAFPHYFSRCEDMAQHRWRAWKSKAHRLHQPKFTTATLLAICPSIPFGGARYTDFHLPELSDGHPWDFGIGRSKAAYFVFRVTWTNVFNVPKRLQSDDAPTAPAPAQSDAGAARSSRQPCHRPPPADNAEPKWAANP